MNTRIPWFKRLTLLALSVQLSACLNTSPTTTDQTESVGTAATVMRNEGCAATETDNYESYITPDWQRASPTVQKMVIASDPQAFRIMTASDPYHEEFNESKWREKLDGRWSDNFGHYRKLGDYHVPLLINGDMTEYGHGDERKVLQGLMKKWGDGKGPLMLPGLGNHDYDQNVNDCGNNGCARDAVCDHIHWVTALKNKSSGVNFDYQWLTRSSTHRGSLAYSVDVGNIHIVQLNNHPNYAVKFETGGLPNFNPKARFDITPSMDWLESDLKAAKAKGKYTIINMHRWSWTDAQLARFTQLAEDNKVIAVFLGHVHRQLGHVWNIGKVPVFQDGALLARSYLDVTFNWNTKIMQVNAEGAGFRNIGFWKYNMDTLEEIVTPPPPPPPPERTATITMYPRKNFQGEPCTFTMESYADKYLVVVCPSIIWSLNPSIKVKNYTGSLVGLEGITAGRYIKNNYSGDFELPDLDLDDNKQLPPPLTLGGRGIGGIGGFTSVHTRPWNK